MTPKTMPTTDAMETVAFFKSGFNTKKTIMKLTGFDEDDGTALLTRRILRYTLIVALVALADLMELNNL